MITTACLASDLEPGDKIRFFGHKREVTEVMPTRPFTHVLVAFKSGLPEWFVKDAEIVLL